MGSTFALWPKLALQRAHHRLIDDAAIPDHAIRGETQPARRSPHAVTAIPKGVAVPGDGNSRLHDQAVRDYQIADTEFSMLARRMIGVGCGKS